MASTRRSQLNPFSYVVLALVGREGAGPHDLVSMMRRGRMYWTAAESHYYAEPKRLERLGYLTSRRERGKTTERTHYELTDAGREALRAWIAKPTPLPRIQQEAAVRLLAADLADDESVLASLRAMRTELIEASAQLDEGEALAAALPHRERYLLLIHRLGRSVVNAQLTWLDEVERELGRPGRA